MKKLLLFALILIVPATCAAQTTVRALGGYVRIGQQSYVIIEIKPTQLIKEVSFTLTYDSTRLEPILFDVGNTLASIPGDFLAEAEPTVIPGKVGFRLTMSLGKSLCCPNQYSHFFSVLMRDLSGSGTSAIGFDDSVYPRMVKDVNNVILNTSWASTQLSVLPFGVGGDLRYENATLMVGQTREVPVYLYTRGGENAVSFTLLYPAALLGFGGTSSGPDATSGSLVTNLATPSRIGIVLALPPGASWTAGERHILTLRFRPADLSSVGLAKLWYSDDPVQRELVAADATNRPLIFSQNALQIVAGLEGDVSPRPEGSGSVSLQDFVQIGRFAVGLDASIAGLEFQKADCAPRETKGDGRISLSDYVQAGRYAASLDPTVSQGGPSSALPFSAEAQAKQVAAPRSSRLPSHARTVLLTQVPSRKGDVTYTLELDGFGDENAVSFSLEFTGSMKLVSAEPDDPGAMFHVNQSVPGKIGVILAMPPGQGLGRRLLTLKFEGKGDVRFAEGPVAGELVTVDAKAVGVDVVFGAQTAVSAGKQRGINK